MSFRVTFTCPPGIDRGTASMLVAGQVYEAEHYYVNGHGGLELYNLVFPTIDRSGDPVRVVVIEFAPGVWRSIAPVAVGAASTTEAPQRENPGRRITPRQV